MRTRAGRAAAGVLCVVGLLAACGDDEPTEDTGTDPAGTDDSTDAATAAGADATTAGGQDGAAVEGTVTVLAASSLTDAFDEIGAAFERANPGADVEFSFGGSSDLREQLLAGAPADVFASANPSNMDAVVDGGAVAGDPEPFVTNSLEIVVPEGNPAGVEGLEDFADEDLLLGLCAEEVPCGEFGREALANAGVAPAPDTNEPDVRSLLDRVSSGELDAGIVYVTDVRAAGDAVEGIEIPEDVNVVAEYPIATLAEAGEPEAAQAFVDFVLSEDGQAILASYGFGPPGAE
jgi:molybdate transport system substrate-binding protein